MIPAANGSHDLAGAAGGPFRRVLVAWDGSPDSVAALRTAAAMVGDGPGHVVALAVLPEAPHVEAERGQAGEESAGLRWVQDGFERARASITATSRARIDLHTAEGRQVARSLCAYATEHGFDLLVLGRHGGGGMLHPRLGRVAETAARASAVPVLLVSVR
ncbi:MAG TPA: universal stress protein [Streptosporangiaceae bacterium]|nr:universal stress protein [Streptosporangiaceae bacterium]